MNGYLFFFASDMMNRKKGLRINGPKEFYAGLFFTVVGTIAFLWSQHYTVGSATHMGPGYFPALISILLVGLGVASVVQGIRTKVPTSVPLEKREPIVLIVGGILCFSLLIERAGLLLAIAVLMFFACFRRLLSNPLEVFLTYVVLAGFSAVVFVYALGMAIRVFPWG